MDNKIAVTIARGDGIGPEIMDAVLLILEKANVNIQPEFIEIGEKVYRQGFSSGMKPEAWESIQRNKVILKAPITTPQGGGYKSLNVTIRTAFGLFANVRPTKAMHPFVKTHFPNLDVVIVRENEEDLYTGIEYRQTAEVTQALKLISVPGTERIVRYAFEYARTNGRKKVTCMVKDNIMKITDGLFANIFREVGKEYPQIVQEIKIIDIGAALLAERPETFDVVVTTNLYGDIISDIVAQVSGSVGMGGSANIGETVSMFEAIHGSAPDIAGKNIANPSGLLNAAIMMLVHLGQQTVAATIANAWLRTIEDGIHTGDIYKEGQSVRKVGTKEFAEAVVQRLGQLPAQFTCVVFPEVTTPIQIPPYKRKVAEKKLVGVDLFLDWPGSNPTELSDKLNAAADGLLTLKMITNRGVMVYPEMMNDIFCTDHWRCRFVKESNTSKTEATIPYAQVIMLLIRIEAAGLETIKTENLYTFNGELGFSLGQGE
ncbi:NADP-dependent isocitrate dehydrogenase [Williamwhitmania taraxaci]|nr:NADP-dependent isocitrate dehydrogenase [Williamwhitmania taraxaci]